MPPFQHFLIQNTMLLEVELPYNQSKWMTRNRDRRFAPADLEPRRVFYQVKKAKVKGDELSYRVSCRGLLWIEEHWNVKFECEFGQCIHDGFSENDATKEEMGPAFMERINEPIDKREDWNMRQKMQWLLGITWLRGAERFSLEYKSNVIKWSTDPHICYLEKAMAVQLNHLPLQDFVSHEVYVPVETYDAVSRLIQT